jgi:hypothetical protein
MNRIMLAVCSPGVGRRESFQPIRIDERSFRAQVLVRSDKVGQGSALDRRKGFEIRELRKGGSGHLERATHIAVEQSPVEI